MEDAVCIVDTAYRFTYVNPAFVRRFGDGWGRHCYAVFHDRAAPCPGCKMPAVFAGRSQTWELQDKKSGYTYEVFDTPLHDQDGNLLNLEILHDITARKQAELSLAQRTLELETLADNSPDIIVRVNRQLQYTFVNRRWTEYLGRTADEAIGKTARELGLPEALCHHGEHVHPEVFAAQQMREEVLDLPTARGVRRFQLHLVPEFGDDGGEPQTILIIGRDITEQTGLQEELIQAQKMEVVGRLAAGIAHDINNVLTAVSGYAALARAELPAEHRAVESLHYLEDMGIQAAGVAKGLLAFSHQAPMNRQPIDLHAVVLGAERLLRRLLPASINLVCAERDTGPVWISGDAVQVQQVILNLAINSRDAMPDGGSLRVALQCFAAEPGETPERRGSVARLTVSDSGTGIAAEVLPRLF